MVVSVFSVNKPWCMNNCACKLGFFVHIDFLIPKIINFGFQSFM